MRLTVAWLCVCLAIYCSGGFTSHGQGNGVLSLPPSLIAATEAVALRQLQQTQQQPLQPLQSHEQARWKKDARVLSDSGNDALRDMVHSKEPAKYILPYNVDEVEQQQQQQPADFNRKALSEPYDLEARQQQSAPQEIAQQHDHRLGLGPRYATPTPHKYWTSLCNSVNGNCAREYNRAMLAVRNREAVARLQQELNDMQDNLDAGHEDVDDDYSDMDSVDSNEDFSLRSNNNEVFMLLTGEQDLVKFLHWAMQLLYPHHNPNVNLSSNAADYYHPGMFIWKKLNFSGHLEPPLIVDEPHYILVRREHQNKQDGYQLGDELKVQDDPFIPPRGRKHQSPDLGALFNRYETFMPNRGRRDKVKDIFKYDDLFFPNRGKKHRSVFQLNDPFFTHRGKKLELRNLYSNDDPFFPNRGKRQLKLPQQQQAEWQGKVQRKLEADKDNDKGDNWPQRMSTHEINGNDQSVKPSMSVASVAAAAATEGASRWQHLAAATARLQQLLPANRLHTTRSMSANLQQPRMDLQQRLRFIVNPNGMRQQQPPQQQQVKTSWPAESWQQSFPVHNNNNARETQLTRGLNVRRPGHDIDTDYGQLEM